MHSVREAYSNHLIQGRNSFVFFIRRAQNRASATQTFPHGLQYCQLKHSWRWRGDITVSDESTPSDNQCGCSAKRAGNQAIDGETDRAFARCERFILRLGICIPVSGSCLGDQSMHERESSKRSRHCSRGKHRRGKHGDQSVISPL